MRRLAAQHTELPADGRAADMRSLRQLTLLVMTGLLCTAVIFLFLVFAAVQAVSAINTLASGRERLQVERAIAAMPAGVNSITLAAMAQGLHLA